MKVHFKMNKGDHFTTLHIASMQIKYACKNEIIKKYEFFYTARSHTNTHKHIDLKHIAIDLTHLPPLHIYIYIHVN